MLHLALGIAVILIPVSALGADISCSVRVSNNTVSWRVTADKNGNTPLGLIAIKTDGRREILNEYVEPSGSMSESLSGYARIGLAVIATGKSSGGDLLCFARLQ